MFEKVNPYHKEELNKEAVAHLCGCRCRTGTGTMNIAIQEGMNINACAATCDPTSTTNRQANITEAYSDRKW